MHSWPGFFAARLRGEFEIGLLFVRLLSLFSRRRFHGAYGLRHPIAYPFAIVLRRPPMAEAASSEFGRDFE